MMTFLMMVAHRWCAVDDRKFGVGNVSLTGSFRFHAEYALAARLIGDGRIDVKPIITASFPVERAAEAFELAGDRRTQMKVQITFD